MWKSHSTIIVCLMSPTSCSTSGWLVVLRRQYVVVPTSTTLLVGLLLVHNEIWFLALTAGGATSCHVVKAACGYGVDFCQLVDSVSKIVAFMSRSTLNWMILLNSAHSRRCITSHMRVRCRSATALIDDWKCQFRHIGLYAILVFCVLLVWRAI